MRSWATVLLTLLLALPVPAQDFRVAFSSLQPTPSSAGVAGPHVPGLTLPLDFTVTSDEGFIEIEAGCAGEVRWYVLGSTKIKYKAVGNTLVLAVPQGGQIVVLAVGLVDGKLTEVARTNITVTTAGPTPPPPPGPGPTPIPIPIPGKLFATIVEDPQARTQAIAAVINSTALREALGIVQGRGSLRVVASTDPFLKTKNLEPFITQAGGLPALLVQDETGAVRLARRLPATEAEAIAIIRQLRGP